MRKTVAKKLRKGAKDRREYRLLKRLYTRMTRDDRKETLDQLAEQLS